MNPNRPATQWGNLSLLRLGAFGFGITGFFLAMDAVILPVLVLDVAPEEAKNTFLGMLGLGGMAVAALVQPLIGWYSDKTRSPLGRRVPYMAWGSVFVCLGLAALGFTSSYVSLFVIWVLIQANASISYGPFQAVIRDLVPVNKIGIASSLKILADASGGMVLIAVSGTLLGRYTGPESFIWLWITLGTVGGVLLITAIITSCTVLSRERPENGSRSAEQRSNPTSSDRLHPQLTWFVGSRYLLIAAIAVFPTYGLFFLRDVVQVTNPAQTFGTMILSIGGALALSVYPAGWLSDKIGRKPVSMAGAIAAAVGTIGILYTDSAMQIMVIASFTGVAIGVLLSANWALANEIGSSGRAGQHMGIVNLATVGGVASTKMLGPGVDILNLESSAAGYSALLIGSAVFFLFGALLLLPLRTNLDNAQNTDNHTQDA